MKSLRGEHANPHHVVVSTVHEFTITVELLQTCLLTKGGGVSFSALQDVSLRSEAEQLASRIHHSCPWRRTMDGWIPKGS